MVVVVVEVGIEVEVVVVVGIEVEVVVVVVRSIKMTGETSG